MKFQGIALPLNFSVTEIAVINKKQKKIILSDNTGCEGC